MKLNGLPTLTLATHKDSRPAMAVGTYLALAVIAFLGLYASTFQWLGYVWRTSPYRTYQILAVLIAGGLLWRQRTAWKELPDAPDRRGWWFLVGGLALHWMGLRMGVQVLSGVSLLPVVHGLILLRWGPKHLRLVRFPLYYLLFAFPLLYLVDAVASVPLRLAATKIALQGLNLVHLTALQEGTKIITPRFALDVEQPCSGLKSLATLAMMGLLYVHLGVQKPPSRWLVAASIVPIAILANGVRVFTIALLGHYWGPEVARRFLHEISGLVLFAAACVLLLSLGRIADALAEVLTRRTAHPNAKPQSPTPSPPLRGSSPANPPTNRLFKTLAGFGLAVWAFTGATTYGEIKSETLLRVDTLPRRLAGWQGTELPLTPHERELVSEGATLRQTAWTRGRGETVGLALLQSGRNWRVQHAPEVCYESNGWAVLKEDTLELPPVGKIRQLQVERGGEQQLVWYWFTDGRHTADHYLLRLLYLAWERLLFRRLSSWLLVRLATPLKDDLAARQRLHAFVQALTPWLRPRPLTNFR
ncbi:MAG TPA: EpsI family protein [Armatimonadetes bacterium]|nr:EpsI family protein [Armatimonadota bacterium]